MHTLIHWIRTFLWPFDYLRTWKFKILYHPYGGKMVWNVVARPKLIYMYAPWSWWKGLFYWVLRDYSDTSIALRMEPGVGSPSMGNDWKTREQAEAVLAKALSQWVQRERQGAELRAKRRGFRIKDPEAFAVLKRIEG